MPNEEMGYYEPVSLPKALGNIDGVHGIIDIQKYQDISNKKLMLSASKLKMGA